MPLLREAPPARHSEMLLTRALDATSEKEVRSSWRALTGCRKPVLLDLTELPHADGRLARLLRWCRGQAALHQTRWAVVTGGNAWVHPILERLLWYDDLPVFQNREQAIRYLTSMVAPVGVDERPGPLISAIRWRADPASGEFHYVSANAEEIMGDPPSRWLAHPGYLLERIDSRDRGRWRAAWERAACHGLPAACDCRLNVAGVPRRAQIVLLPPGSGDETVRQLRGTLVLLPAGRRAPADRPPQAAGGVAEAWVRARNSMLNPVERAEALQHLKELTGAPWKQIARDVGLSHTYLRKLVGVLKLEESVLTSLRERRIPLRTALALKPLPEEQQTELARKAEEESIPAELIRQAPNPEEVQSVSARHPPNEAARRLRGAALASRARSRELRLELNQLLGRG